MSSLKKKQQQQINIHNKHVKKMILLHSTPRAEEDKVAPSVTFAHLKEIRNFVMDKCVVPVGRRRKVYQYEPR